MNRIAIHCNATGPSISRHLHGQFAEHLGAGIYGGLWVGEDSPIPNTRGLRDDVIAALRAIKVPNIRWPGGCFAETYHWRDGIGSRDQRPERFNCWSCGTIENNHFGTHEFLDLCEQIGAEPYICGNLGGGTIQEMADWLLYLTVPAASPLSKERRLNGREAPWAIKWWAVGNENWGCGGHMAPEHYAWEYRRYQTFCRNHSGGKLFRVACGFDEKWNDIVLRESSDYIDGLSIHHYCRMGTWGRDGDPTDFTFDVEGVDVGFEEKQWWATMGMADELDGFIRRNHAVLSRHDPEGRIGLVVDEWGTWHLEPADKPAGAVLYQRNTMRDAVAAAHSLHILQRFAARVPMANIAQMIITDWPRLFLTPTYHVFAMLQKHQDATSLPVDFESPVRMVGDGLALQTLSVSASRSPEGRVLVSLVNLDPSHATEVEIELRELESTDGLSATILGEVAMDAHNTFDAPDLVSPRDFRALVKKGNRLKLTIPAASVISINI